jgi:hypothetical protein
LQTERHWFLRFSWKAGVLAGSDNCPNERGDQESHSAVSMFEHKYVLPYDKPDNP